MIHLANPIGLLGLLLVPVLILIHALAAGPRKAEITTLFLLDDVLKRERSGIHVRRIIHNLPLVLQIVAVVLASVALAGPIRDTPTGVSGNLILVIDTGAGMKTRTESGTRFDRAKKHALQLVNDLSDAGRMMIITSGAHPMVRTGFTNDKRKLRRRIGDIQPADAPGKAERALHLAISFLDSENENRITFITDHAGPDALKLMTNHPVIQPVFITGGKTNIGITRFNFRKTRHNAHRFEVMVEIMNFSRVSMTCPIRVDVDERPIMRETPVFEPREKKSFFLPWEGPVAGIASATLEIEDDFSTDNTAWTVLRPGGDIWVLMATKGNYFLEKLLSAFPHVMVNTIDRIIPSSWEEQVRSNDLVIVDRMPFPKTGTGNLLLIDSWSDSLPLETSGYVAGPDVIDVDDTHPVTAHLDLAGLHIDRAARIDTKDADSIHALVESRETGLIHAWETEKGRTVLLGFDPAESDLPLRVAFPVLMGNILQWLRPDRFSFSAQHTRAGEPIAIHAEPGTESIIIRTPSNKMEKRLYQSSPTVYPHTNEVGIYTVTAGRKRRYYAVNLLDETESEIPAPMPGMMEKAAGHQEHPRDHSGSSIWFIFMIAAGGAFFLEWYVWIRGG